MKEKCWCIDKMVLTGWSLERESQNVHWRDSVQCCCGWVREGWVMCPRLPWLVGHYAHFFNLDLHDWNFLSQSRLLSTQKGSDILMEIQFAWISVNYPGIIILISVPTYTFLTVILFMSFKHYFPPNTYYNWCAYYLS